MGKSNVEGGGAQRRHLGTEKGKANRAANPHQEESKKKLIGGPKPRFRYKKPPNQTKGDRLVTTLAGENGEKKKKKGPTEGANKAKNKNTRYGNRSSKGSPS